MPKSRKLRPSSTPGRSKGENCHKSQTKNRHALDARWYKTDPVGYAKACEEVNKQKGNQQSAWTKQFING